MKDSGAKKSRVIRNETPMGRVVYLRPETQKSAPTLWSWSSAFHGRPLAFILIAILAISSLALTVSGSSFDYYPDNCLGSWRGPENAQGKPNIKVNLASPRSFTQENSAVFFGGTQSIICQSFSGQSIPDDTTLESLTLSLSLSVKHPAISDVPAEVAPEESGGDSGGESGDTEFIIVDEPIVEPTTEDEGADLNQQDPAPEIAPADETPEEPASEPAAEPEQGQEPSESAEPSAFLLPFINRARAQEASGLLATVLYSLNGTDWQALGQVTEESWQNLSFKIPVGQGGVAAVADIPNVRIRLDAGFFSVDSPIEIYLDGMTVEINTDEYVSPEEAIRLDEMGALDGEPGVILSAMEQIFSLDRTVIPTAEVLPWQPYDYQIANIEDSKDITRSVATIDSKTDDIIVSGSCKKEYFTVLVFRDPQAYANAPRTALFNSAYPCDNGLYSYRLTPSALRLKAGVYYLLVAEQGEGEPWVPISAIMPFSIEEELLN